MFNLLITPLFLIFDIVLELTILCLVLVLVLSWSVCPGFFHLDLESSCEASYWNLLFYSRQHIFETSYLCTYGNRSSHFLGKSFFYPYDVNYTSDLIVSDKVKGHHFPFIKRFIVDLCTLNNGGEFSRVHKDIYPSELELKVEFSGSRTSFSYALCLQ